MLDNFREWLSDNLRYILLGLAAILLVVIAFFAVRLIKGIGSPDKKEPETRQSTELSTEAAPEEKDAENKMVKEPADSVISQFVVQYYNAVAAKDYEAVAALFENFTDEDKAEIEGNSAIETYNNISAYSKNGLEENSYIVYAYYDAKVTGIETLAPCLSELYLVTNADGKLVLSDRESSQARKDYLLERRADADVQALVQDVTDLMAAAKEQDADLAAYVDSQGSSTGGDGADADGTANAGTAATGPMKALETINVREQTSAESTLYGTVMAGTQVEVLENTDGGWSKIRYTVNGITIEGYVMTQYLGPIE